MALSWTDNPIVAQTTMIQATHFNEMRNYLINEYTKRGGSPPSVGFGEATAGNVDYASDLQALRDYFSYYYPNGSAWTPSDNPLSVQTTPIKALHINELRSKIEIVAANYSKSGIADCGGTCSGYCNNTCSSCTGACLGTCQGCQGCSSCSGCSWYG